MFLQLIEAFEKGFQTEDQLKAVMLGFDGKREQSKDRESLKKYIKKKVVESENPDNPLFLLNHIRQGRQQLVSIPFNLSGDRNIDGVVRLRILEDKIINIALNASIDGVESWGFIITPYKSSYGMKIFCKEPKKIRESESFSKFVKKLQNLQVKIDDNLKDITFYNYYDSSNTDLDVFA